jgi:hypothetical protein
VTREYPRLPYLLACLHEPGRGHLRNVLIRDQADCDLLASRLMRYRDQNGQDWADIIIFLTMHPEARRRVVRLLGEIGAEGRIRASPSPPEPIRDLECRLSRLGDQGGSNTATHGVSA